MRMRGKRGTSTEKSVSDVIIPHGRERVKLQRAVAQSTVCARECVLVRTHLVRLQAARVSMCVQVLCVFLRYTHTHTKRVWEGKGCVAE